MGIRDIILLLLACCLFFHAGLVEAFSTSTFSTGLNSRVDSDINTPLVGDSDINTPLVGDSDINTPLVGDSDINTPLVGDSDINTPLVGDSDINTLLVGDSDINTPLVGDSDINTPLVGDSDINTPLVGDSDINTPLVGDSDINAPLVGDSDINTPLVRVFTDPTEVTISAPVTDGDRTTDTGTYSGETKSDIHTTREVTDETTEVLTTPIPYSTAVHNDRVVAVLDNLLDYPPGQQLYKNGSSLLSQLSPKMETLLKRLTDEQIPQNEERFVLTKLSTNDVKKMLYNILQLPIDVQDNIIHLEGWLNLTVPEWKIFPTEMISILTKRQLMRLVQGLPIHRGIALCERLIGTVTSPIYLHVALSAGLSCTHHVIFYTPMKILPTASNANILMMYMRRQFPTWYIAKPNKVFEKLGQGVTSDDIRDIPSHIFKDRKLDTDVICLPYESQRHLFVKRLMSPYTTPTSWNTDFLVYMRKFLDDMSVDDIILIRKDTLLDAQGLDETLIKHDITNIALASKLQKTLRVSPGPELIYRFLPWLKADKQFLQNINLTNFLEAMRRRFNDLSPNVQFTSAEQYQLSHRLQLLHVHGNIGLNNERDLKIGELLDGLTTAYLEKLTRTIIDKQYMDKHFHSFSYPKALYLYRRVTDLKSGMKVTNDTVNIDSILSNTSSSSSNVAFDFLVKGLHSPDLTIPIDIWQTVVQNITESNFPTYIQRAIVKKVNVSYFDSLESSRFCNGMALFKLGQLAIHVAPSIFDTLNVPLNDEDCNINFDKIELTRAQTYALIDKIRSTRMSKPDTDVFVTASFVKRLGKLCTGLSEEDIAAIPLDRELFTIVELLSQYEDEFDSSQIEAIVSKIKEYFDWPNRNVIDEMSNINIIQIGRFLQYFNPEFELTKIPLLLRSSIGREIGKSSLNNISTGKRRELLEFVLKHKKISDNMVVDLTRAESIAEYALMDLGNLKCGVTLDIIYKLTSAAITQHMPDFKTCPFHAAEAKALLEKALDYNINLLTRMDLLATLGPLLEHLTDAVDEVLNKRELASIAEYLIKYQLERDLLFQTQEKNGFIRERMSTEKREDTNRSLLLIKKIHAALINEYGGDSCVSALRLMSAAPTVDDVTNANIIPCLESVANLQTWNSKAARKMLETVIRYMFGDALENAILKQKLTPDLILRLPGLIKGLDSVEMSTLNMNDPEVLPALGSFDGYSVDQLRSGFENWKQSRNGHVTSFDLSSIGNFACGIPNEIIKNDLETGAVLENIEVLGSLRCLNRDQLTVYADVLHREMRQLVGQWKQHHIIACGSLIGGFSATYISELQRSQIRVLSPDVITNMPADKVKEFTTTQLASMTSNQINAITNMQRSFMTEEQLLTLTGPLVNSGIKIVSSVSVALIMLLVVVNGVLEIHN